MRFEYWNSSQLPPTLSLLVQNGTRSTLRIAEVGISDPSMDPIQILSTPIIEIKPRSEQRFEFKGVLIPPTDSMVVFLYPFDSIDVERNKRDFAKLNDRLKPWFMARYARHDPNGKPLYGYGFAVPITKEMRHSSLSLDFIP